MCVVALRWQPLQHTDEVCGLNSHAAFNAGTGHLLGERRLACAVGDEALASSLSQRLVTVTPLAPRWGQWTALRPSGNTNKECRVAMLQGHWSHMHTRA